MQTLPHMATSIMAGSKAESPGLRLLEGRHEFPAQQAHHQHIQKSSPFELGFSQNPFPPEPASFI